MAEKETRMKLHVNLECEKCCKKVKKLLAKYPREIREQKFDKKENTVTILVVCCSPEKIRDKLCCKGGGCITKIEILEPPTDKPQKVKPREQTDPPTPIVKLPSPLVQINVNTPVPPQIPDPVRTCCGQCREGRSDGPCVNGNIGPLGCYCGCYGRPACESYGWGRHYYCASRCDQYFSEEYVSVCTIL